MSKIKINSSISGKETEEYKISTNGIKNDNIITYKDDNSLVNIVLSENTISIKRENDEMHQTLKFEKNKENKTNYFIKELNMDIILKTKTNDLLITKDSIRIEYELYMNEEYSDVFTYFLEWSDLK